MYRKLKTKGELKYIIIFDFRDKTSSLEFMNFFE